MATSAFKLRELNARAEVLMEKLGIAVGPASEAALETLPASEKAEIDKMAAGGSSQISPVQLSKEARETLDRKLKETNVEISNIEKQRLSHLTNVRDSIRNLVEKAPQVVSTLLSDVEWSDMVLEEWRINKNGGEIERVARMRAFENKQEVYRGFQTFDYAGRLMMLFELQPMEFAERLKDISDQLNSDTRVFTGNVFIFLSGNIFPIQAKVREIAARPGICEKIARQNPALKLRHDRDPDCIRSIVEKIKKEPETQQLLDDAIYQVLGASNREGLWSRVNGHPSFMDPPGSQHFYASIERELNDVAQDFSKDLGEAGMSPPPTLEFDDSVKTAIYNSEVDALVGYRSIANRGRDLVTPLLSFKLKPTLFQMTGDVHEAS